MGNIRTQGVVELNDLFRQSSFCPNACSKQKSMISLKSLYEIVCDKQMKFKNSLTAQSDWNCFDKLSIEQINYAADDALVGSNIFIKLMANIHGRIDACDYRMECAAYIDLKRIKAKKNKTKNDYK